MSHPQLAAATRRVRDRAWNPRNSVWALPLVVAIAVHKLSEHRLTQAIGGCIALLVLAVAVRRPGKALVVLVAFLALQQFVFGFLLHLGISPSLLQQGGALKELLGIAILLSAINDFSQGGRRLDAIDKAALLYVAAVTFYLLDPGLFSSVAISNLGARLLAWRADCGYVLLFLAVRHAPIPAASRRRVVQVVLGLAMGMVAIGLWQWAARQQFARLALSTGGAYQFLVQVIHDPPLTAQRALQYVTSFSPFRVGSILYDPFQLSDYLVVALGFAVERVVRDHSARLAYVIIGSIGVVLFLTRVRADALAAVVMVLVALAPAPSRSSAARVRLTLLVAVGVLLILPVVAGTRFVGGQGGNASTQQHINEVSGGVVTMYHHPFGLGLGDAPGTSGRFGIGGQLGAFTTDNMITQVGDELGLQALIPWLVFLVAVVIALRREARHGDLVAGGTYLALIGIVFAGQFHHVFLDFPVPWTLWAAIGLTLSREVRADYRSTTSSDGTIVPTPELQPGMAL